MYPYHAAKVISEYLKPLRSSEYAIKDTNICCQNQIFTTIK